MAAQPPEKILVVRLGAMGDVLHTLPSVASLRKSFPESHITWLISRKWMPLLEGNPSIDELVPFERQGPAELLQTWRRLRDLRPELAFDFQGLVQSALAARASRAQALWGFDRNVAREPLASSFYTDSVRVTGPHRIERNLQLIAAAGASALTTESWIPEGRQEAALPRGRYVLASPFAGWRSKEWPIEFYDRLGGRLQAEGLELVVDVPATQSQTVRSFKHATVHSSSVAGLIYATRNAVAVVGVDSGPLHLAAALKKPGVAIFGLTDPAQTGPFQSTIVVLREPQAATTYKRGRQSHSSMAAISVEQVWEALVPTLLAAGAPADRVARSL